MWNIVLVGAVSRRRGVRVSSLGSTLQVGHLLWENSFTSLWFAFIIYKLKTKTVWACLIAGRLKWLHPPCKVLSICHVVNPWPVFAIILSQQNFLFSAYTLLLIMYPRWVPPSALSSRALEWTCSTARLSFFPTPRSSGSLWACGGIAGRYPQGVTRFLWCKV